MIVGISIGDVTGIGMEVTLKALAAETSSGGSRFVLIGDADHIRRLNQRLGLNLSLKDYAEEDSGRFSLYNPFSEKLPADLPAGSPLAARAAVGWVKDGAERCLR